VPSTVLSAIVFLVFNESGATFKNTRIGGLCSSALIPRSLSSSLALYQGTTLQAAEKLNFPKVAKNGSCQDAPETIREPLVKVFYHRFRGCFGPIPSFSATSSVVPPPTQKFLEISPRGEAALKARVKMKDSVYEVIFVT
jgi:hypothetical protein